MKIVVRGTFNQSGFGVATIGLLKALYKTDNEIKFIQVNKDDTHQSSNVTDDTTSFIKSIRINHSSEFIKGAVCIDIGALSFGYNMPQLNGVVCNILYTTTETTLINKPYVKMFNNKYDMIWTASKFNVATLFSSGITIPIKLVPHIIDVDKFNPSLKPYKIKNKKSFNYIVNVDFSYRKGLHILLQAWLKAFSADDDVALIIKIVDFDFKDADRALNAIGDLLMHYDYTKDNHAPILLIPHMIDEEYLPNLYVTGDIYVAPTLGEGFGLPIAEAMACGIPTITSNCSAPSEYVTDKNGFLIHLNEDNIIQSISDKSLLLRDPNYRGRFIYDIDMSSLITQLQKSFKLSKSKLNEIGNIARTDIINMFSEDTVIKILTQVLQEL